MAKKRDKRILWGGIILGVLVLGLLIGKPSLYKGALRGSPAGKITFAAVSANGYPENPGTRLPNTYINLYKVSPVREGIYEGRLIETRKTGANGEPVMLRVWPGDIVDFVAFKDYTKAQNTKYWTFSSPPYKNFSNIDGVQDRLCQINYLKQAEKLKIGSDNKESCTTGMSLPISDGEVVVVPNEKGSNRRYGNFEIWVQETNDPATKVNGAKVRLYDEKTKKQIGEGMTGHRGNVSFVIETGRSFNYNAQTDEKHYGLADKNAAFYLTSDGKGIRGTHDREETRVLRLGAYYIGSAKLPPPLPLAPELPTIIIPGLVRDTALPAETVMPPAVAIREDCIEFNPATSKIVPPSSSTGVYTLMDGGHAVDSYPNSGEAQTAFNLIKQYGITTHCFVGRGGPDKPMEYWLTKTGVAPSHSLQKISTKEDCIPFDPAKLAVKKLSSGEYDVVSGSILFHLKSEKAAQDRVDAIKKHGLSVTCYVGRPDASMIYFKTK